MELSFDDERAGAAIRMLLVVFSLAEFADGLQAVHRAVGLGEEILFHLRAAPAGTADNAHMFRRQDDSGLAERDTAVIRHGIGNAAEYLFGVLAPWFSTLQNPRQKR